MGTENETGYCLYMVDDGFIKIGDLNLTDFLMNKEVENPSVKKIYGGVNLKVDFNNRCKSRKRFIKLMGALGIQRNRASILANCIMKQKGMSYQSLYNDIKFYQLFVNY